MRRHCGFTAEDCILAVAEAPWTSLPDPSSAQSPESATSGGAASDEADDEEDADVSPSPKVVTRHGSCDSSAKSGSSPDEDESSAMA